MAEVALQFLDFVGRELLFFSGIWFFIGLVDEAALDALWLWLRLTGRCKASSFAAPAGDRLAAPAAVLVPCWNEAKVIEPMIAWTRQAWPHERCVIYVGCYRNDAETIAAAHNGAEGDSRVRIVVVPRDGPTTKADCLNLLYDAMAEEERQSGLDFRFVVFHDAEDHVHPLALDLMARELDRADFVQLPVIPELDSRSRWIAGHYADEFAENHGKALVVRDWLKCGLPAAGVGCAFRREMLASIAQRRDAPHPFAADCLTEDYELGLLVHELGGTSRFIRAIDAEGSLIATREYFPGTVADAVRQKSRWIHGIAFQGWERLGWTRGFAETWMRLHDRRGPMAAVILLSAYLAIFVWATLFIAERFGLIERAPLSPLLKTVILVALIGCIWRALSRLAFTTARYGWLEGLRAILRMPVANIITIIAARRALAAYVKTLFGHSPVWEKTHHDDHPSTATGASPV